MRKIYFEVDVLAKVNPERVPLEDLYLVGPDGADIEFSDIKDWSVSSSGLRRNLNLRFEAMARADDDLEFGAWARGIRCYRETEDGPKRVNTKVNEVRVTNSR